MVYVTLAGPLGVVDIGNTTALVAVDLKWTGIGHIGHFTLEDRLEANRLAKTLTSATTRALTVTLKMCAVQSSKQKL